LAKNVSIVKGYSIMEKSLSEAGPELLQSLKYVLLDLQGTLELLDLNIHSATGLAPSAEEALRLIKQYDPEWEDPAAYALEDDDEE
jgi:hypothetical protein